MLFSPPPPFFIISLSLSFVVPQSQGVESPPFRKLFSNLRLLDKSVARASGLRDITIRKDRVHLCRIIYHGSTNRLEEVSHFLPSF